MSIDSIIGLFQIHKRPEYIFSHLRDTFHTPALQQTLGLCIPPVGSEWIISVADYVDNSFAALGSSDPWEVHPFSICSSPFCFLLTLFPCVIKYYHIMFINISPPPGDSGWTIGVD